MKNQVILILLGLLTGFSCFAQEDKQASFSIQVAYDSIGMEEQFEVTYTLKNTKAVANFQAPAFEDFNLLAGPMTSSSMSIINGDMTQSVSYTYILQPTKMGIFNISATSIETEVGTLVTDDVALVVVEKMERPQHNNSVFRDPFSNDPFFNDPFFNQSFNPQQRMNDMMKNFDKMFKIDPPTYYENGPNKSPKKEPKKKEKTYKI